MRLSICFLSSLLTTSTLASTALLDTETSLSPLSIFQLALTKRATPNCKSSQGEKACGDFCIPSTFTCCPDKTGGCDSNTKTCVLGTNGAYGCCLKGKVCAGPGGLISTSTRPGTTATPVAPTPAAASSVKASTTAVAPAVVTSVQSSASLEPLTSTVVVYTDSATRGIATPSSIGPPTFTNARATATGVSVGATAGSASPFGSGSERQAFLSIPLLASLALFGVLLA